MASKRSLLFYLGCATDSCDHNGPAKNTIADTLGVIILTHTFSYGDCKLTASTSHFFYDWGINELPPNMRVADVPDPGIVIVVAIRIGTADPYMLAMRIKLELEAATNKGAACKTPRKEAPQVILQAIIQPRHRPLWGFASGSKRNG